MKVKNGLDWYKKVYNLLLSNECYLITTTTNEQKLSLIDIINSNKGCGIRLKVENKKYGLYLSRCKRGDSAIVTKDLAIKYCQQNGLDFDIQVRRERIVRYTAKLFKDGRQLKNLFTHRGKKAQKGLTYNEQLKTESWKKFRRLVFSKRGKECEMCGSKENLQVHHPSYIHGRKAWEYSLNEVVVLCRDCHEKVHNLK